MRNLTKVEHPILQFTREMELVASVRESLVCTKTTDSRICTCTLGWNDPGAPQRVLLDREMEWLLASGCGERSDIVKNRTAYDTPVGLVQREPKHRRRELELT